MTDNDVYAALRGGDRRGESARVVIAVVVCSLVAWLGYCGVCVMYAYRDAVIGQSCTRAGGDWFGGDCRQPEVNVTIEAPAQQDDEPSPFNWSAPGAS